MRRTSLFHSLFASVRTYVDWRIGVRAAFILITAGPSDIFFAPESRWFVCNYFGGVFRVVTITHYSNQHPHAVSLTGFRDGVPGFDTSMKESLEITVKQLGGLLFKDVCKWFCVVTMITRTTPAERVLGRDYPPHRPAQLAHHQDAGLHIAWAVAAQA